PGHGGGLAGAGGPEQDRVRGRGPDPAVHLVDGPWLVARGHHVGDHLERRHAPLEIADRTHSITPSPAHRPLPVRAPPPVHWLATRAAAVLFPGAATFHCRTGIRQRGRVPPGPCVRRPPGPLPASGPRGPP